MKAIVNQDTCIGCGLCTNACLQGAASLREAHAGELLPQPDDE